MGPYTGFKQTWEVMSPAPGIAGVASRGPRGRGAEQRSAPWEREGAPDLLLVGAGDCDRDHLHLPMQSHFFFFFTFVRTPLFFFFPFLLMKT